MRITQKVFVPFDFLAKPKPPMRPIETEPDPANPAPGRLTLGLSSKQAAFAEIVAEACRRRSARFFQAMVSPFCGVCGDLAILRSFEIGGKS